MNKKCEKILNTSIKLFLKHGVKKVTMDDIAEQARVSKVTVYKYFSDKDTLYYEVGKQILSDQLSKLKAILESGNSLVNMFYDYIEIMSHFTDSHLLFLCSELQKYNDRLSGEYFNYNDEQDKTLLYLINEGFQSGTIKKDLDKQMVFHLIKMGLVYYQQNEEYRSIMRSDSSFQKSFLVFLLSGIFVDVQNILNG